MGTLRPRKPQGDYPHSLEAYAAYLIHERGHSPRGVLRYLQDLRLWFRFLEEEGLKPSPEAVRRLLLWRQPSPRRAQGFLAALRGYYRYLAQVQKEEVEDPTAEVGRPKAGRRLPLHPTLPEVKALLRAAQEEREKDLLQNLIRFLYGTGLRISEALSLRGEHLLFEGGKPLAIRVVGKGNKERLVPLSPLAQRVVRGLKPPPQGFLFTFQEGRRRGFPPSARWVERKFRALALKAGLDPRRLTPHKLRHAYATHLVEQGVSLDAVKDLLGHASIATTQIYLHATPERLRKAVEKLPSL